MIRKMSLTDEMMLLTDQGYGGIRILEVSFPDHKEWYVQACYGNFWRNVYVDLRTDFVVTGHGGKQCFNDVQLAMKKAREMLRECEIIM